LVEFDNSFYTDIFRERSLTNQEKDLYRLRLCAFIDLNDQKRKFIEFRQSFASRYVSVMFTERNNRDLGGENDPNTPGFVNYDVQTIYF
jgi:hypothetical protein